MSRRSTGRSEAERVLHIVEVLRREPSGVGIAELARDLDVSQERVKSDLAVIEAAGYGVAYVGRVKLMLKPIVSATPRRGSCGPENQPQIDPDTARGERRRTRFHITHNPTRNRHSHPESGVKTGSKWGEKWGEGLSQVG
jgi:hypothetical protein